jgi:hypothetical protein
METVGHLKKAGCLLWLHGRNYHRILWAREHPDVAGASALLYRGQWVLKETLHCRFSGTALPGRIGAFHPEEDFQIL